LKKSNENSKEISEDKKTKINFYSKNLKLLYIIIALISSSILFLNLCFLNNHSASYNNRNFELEFARFCYNVVDAKLNLQSEAHIQKFYLENYDKPVTQSSSDIPDTYVSITNPTVTTTRIATETNAVETTKKSSDSYSKTYTTDKIKERTADFNKINSDLSDTINFVYLIIDTKTDQILDTNIDKNPNIAQHADNNANGYTYTNAKGDSKTFTNAIDILKLQSNFVSFTAGKANGDLYGNYKSNIESLIKKTETSKYNVYCAVIEPIRLNANGVADSFYNTYTAHKKIVPVYKTAMAANLFLGLIFVLSLILIALTVGQQEKHGEVTLLKTDKLYFDVHTLILLLITFIALSGGSIDYELLPAFLLCALIGLNYYSSGFRLLKARKFFRNTLTYRILKSAKDFFIDINILIKAGQKYQLIIFISIILLLCLFNGFLYLYMVTSMYGGVFLFVIGIVLLDLLFVAWIVRLFISIHMVKLATKEISAGQVDYAIPTQRLSGNLKALAEDITHIQAGLSKAVDEAIKGERLKTELITNVSHDLKTPLTSIINYVDLLKKEELNNEKAASYITVLEEKSGRLKQLIEDLVEASKASSGSLSVTVEKVDLQQLILQACGEYNEKLLKTGLDLRINYSGNGILVAADGKHMWRVIENLLSNISKYAQPNSRVYIDISQSSNFGILTLKNISKNPLDISPSELTQRFVRGDSSRTTEGSGLGLSIAQSLTILQGGKFNISIDGDLFKVIIEIPLWIK
jgi:signal transduction histidine kinase